MKIRARDRALAVLAVLGFLAVGLAASAQRPVQHPAGPAAVASGTPRSRTDQAQHTDVAQQPPSGHVHLRLPWSVLGRLAVLAAALGLLALIWLIVGVVPRLSYRRRRPARAPPIEQAPVALAAPVTEQVRRLLSGALADVDVGDANRAIIACWLRLEQLAESAGYVRLPAETSTELVAKWLSGTRLPEDALTDLAALYREARYSGHRLDRAGVERARAALTGLRHAFDVAGSAGRADG
ncbi:MAG TPA: DUF4129 domain-containing protein [Jatrophihabitans sp.]|nr:DUF4129 domain-containing protein [Jatrophihabitans sp.]